MSDLSAETIQKIISNEPEHFHPKSINNSTLNKKKRNVNGENYEINPYIDFILFKKQAEHILVFSDFLIYTYTVPSINIESS